MNPQDQNPVQPPLQPAVQVNNPLSVMGQGERNICEIKRHPIGIIGTYIGAGILIIVLAVLAFGVGPIVFKDHRSQVIEIGALAFVIVTALTLGFVAIANKVYWGNRWILTSDSLTQVLQRSLFDKQSSQLSLGNLEDVTAQKDGIFARIFNYGVLRVETAGERSKFVFAYCPDTEHYAQEILRAREDFEQRRQSDDSQRLYQAAGTYAGSAQPPAAAPQPQSPIQNTPVNSGADGVNIDTES